VARQFFDATAAGVTLSKTLWPGTLAATLPAADSGKAADLTSGGVVVGGVLAKVPGWDSVLLDFAAVGSADQTLVVEIGSFDLVNSMARVLASLSLKSITNSGTVATGNPFTGVVDGKTWRLFDLLTVASKAGLGQVLASVGGAEDDTPTQVVLDVSEAQFYYAVITTLPAGLTEVFCAFNPVPN
jgi:hypothetical protein